MTGECSKTTHATGFSQWLITNLVASPFMGDGRLTAVWASPDATIYHRLALPISLSLVPSKSALNFLRHQLRTKVRSTICL